MASSTSTIWKARTNSTASRSPVRTSQKPVLAALPSTLPAPSYLVGGWVRDCLLGRPTKDLDLAVSGDALPLAQALARRLDGSFVPLDPAHGIARVGFPAPGITIDLS